MDSTRRIGWAMAIGALAVLLAAGCGEITAADETPDAGGAGLGGHILAELGSGGAPAQGIGGAAMSGTGGQVLGPGGATPAPGSGGHVVQGSGGAGGIAYPSCVPTGQPPRPNGCGNASHQQAYLSGYECADCSGAGAPPGYSGYVPPSPTVPPYACLTDSGILCVVDCNACR